MSLWLEILRHASRGEALETERLNFELLQLLRPSEIKGTGYGRDTGPVAKIVRIFVASLPQADRGMAKSRAEDFADYITDLIMAKVRRTVSLVEFGREFPKLSIEQTAERFTGWDGLKLGKDDRAEWVRKHLRSMSFAGIEIDSLATEEACTIEAGQDEIYGYHELALVNKWRADLSWKDFKAQEELDNDYVSVTDAGLEEDPSVGEEVFDYGVNSTARVVLSLGAQKAGENLKSMTAFESAVDLIRMGERLTLDLLDLLEAFHAEKPSDGYFPIAWHNVWWIVGSKYEAVPLDLNERDPFCDADRTLADHIGNTYPAVIKPNRLNIQRRRTKLQDKCVERVNSVLIAWSQNEGSSLS